MQVIHPNGVYQGIQAEDVFLAVDDTGRQLGWGYVIAQEQPGTYPDCPVNIFFHLDAMPEAEYLLLGALMALARQKREQYPGQAARIYTSVQPGDAHWLDFYRHNGFDERNTEDRVLLPIPDDPGRDMLNCQIVQLPLNTLQEQQNLLARLYQNGINHIDLRYLQSIMVSPHFLALGLIYGGKEFIGTCIFAGYGQSAELVTMYIERPHQNQRMGRMLLHRGLAILGSEGVREVTAQVMSASMPQVHLMRAMEATLVENTMVFPCMWA